jgi:hypothetical protein
MHTPQSMQASGLISALPSFIEMASLGHSSTQDSQPVHFSLSTFAGITQPFPKQHSTDFTAEHAETAEKNKE